MRRRAEEGRTGVENGDDGASEDLERRRRRREGKEEEGRVSIPRPELRGGTIIKDPLRLSGNKPLIE